jgi:peroxiredoxin
VDSNISYIILTVLTFSVALNLILTFSVLKSVRNMLIVNEALTSGEKVPDVKCQLLTTGETVYVSSNQRAIVALFLSSACPKCREKLPEIEKLLPPLKMAGVSMWFLSKEPKWRLRNFLKASSVFQITALVSKQDYKTLNPNLTSPYYLFIDHNGYLETSGLIGDENWESFVSQMNGTEVMDVSDE